MADGSKIEWTDATWNPITGCSIVSPGCKNCYAMKLAGTRLRNHSSRVDLTVPSKTGPVWTGQVRFNEQWLTQPLRWRKPRRIFVCAHGDLFHEGVPYEWIDQIFAVMALAPQHTFQVLTKRADRMLDYVLEKRRLAPQWVHLPTEGGRVLLPYEGGWPTHIWLGVSAEDQERANERIPVLQRTPAAVRFVSFEPLLGRIDTTFLGDPELINIDWAIVGGESGRGFRYMDPEWPRLLRDRCKKAGVAFFMKQMAGRGTIPEDLLIREFPMEKPSC